MVAAIGAVAAVGSAAISANAAGSAADSQSESAQAASMQQAMAAAQMRQDLSPWVGTGVAANNRLSQYLGLGMAPGSTMSNGMAAGLTRDQLRNQLLSQYTKQSTTSTQPTGPFNGYNDAGLPGLFEPLYENGKQSGVSFNGNNQYDESGNDWLSKQAGQTGSVSTSTVDEAGLNAAIDKYYADQAAEQAKFSSDPNYGSLLKAYRNGQEFNFTGKDLASEPGYQFGLNQGTQGIERGQASRGNFLSGAAMKELDRFNQDYAGTKFNDAFSREQSKWNTNLGAYNQNRNTIYNFLTGQSTMGQNSAAQVGVNNQQTANNMANNTMAAGNAQAAGQIAGANSMMSGINSAANGLNTAGGWNNLLANNNSVYKPGGTASTGFGSGAGFGNQDMGQYL